MRVAASIRTAIPSEALTTSSPAKAGPTAPTKTAASGETSTFSKVLHGIGKEIERGEGVIKAASSLSSPDLSAGQLIALQVGVYRYSDAVDMASRLVAGATNAVKTVIQSGGQ